MSEEKFDVVVFKGKTFGKLLEEIHTNSRNNDRLILDMIENLKGYIETLGDAIQLAPIIASYVKMSIDTNEHIIKMAGIVQKSLEKAKTSNDDSMAMFSIEEKAELASIALEWEESLKLPSNTPIKGELTDGLKVKSKKGK